MHCRTTGVCGPALLSAICLAALLCATASPAIAAESALATGETAEDDGAQHAGDDEEDEEEEDEGAWGDDDGWGEGDDVGFADIEASTASIAVSTPSTVRLSGFYRSDNAVWLERFDDNPFAKARQNLDMTLRYKVGPVRMVGALHLEYDLAYLYERDSYDQPTLDAYEWGVQGREMFIGVELGPVDFAIGRQIVSWGQGEAISPVDVVNPRDNREPGLADLEDLRMPVLMTRAGLFLGQHRFEAIIIHEASFGVKAAPLSDFSVLQGLLSDRGLQESGFVDQLRRKTVRFEDRPRRFVENEQQILFRWQYTGEGTDLALYGGSILDQQGVIALPALTLSRDPVTMAPRFFDPNDNKVTFTNSHPRYTMFGQSGATVAGAWLFEWELAFAIGRSLNVSGGSGFPPALGVEEHNLLNLMLGATFSGVNNLSITLEFGKTFVVDGGPRSGGTFLTVNLDPNLELGRGSSFSTALEEPVWALRALYTMLRETLTINVALSWWGWLADFGWLVRGEVSYAVNDTVDVGVGFISYQPEIKNSPLKGLDTHDRLFLKLRWDFSLL